MLIDDDEFVREVAQTTLEVVGGWDVISAANGDEGLYRAIHEAPDAIVLDVMMPGSDGPEVLAQLRANPATAPIPVVFMTAKAFASEIERLERLGAAGVITKPFDPMALPARLAALLGW